MRTGRTYPEVEAELKAWRLAGTLRHLPDLDGRAAATVRRNGSPALNLSSNDYLGLGTDRALQKDFFNSIHAEGRWEADGLAASASRLLTGNHPAYTQLENRLAGAYGREAALVFNSGYHANLGILPALVGRGDVIFSDRLNHASLVDGARLSGAKVFRFPHVGYAQLETLLRKHRAAFRRALLVSESLFSMDGDRADLSTLIRLRDEFQAWLLIDEAHAVGVFGATGLGLAQAEGRLAEPDILVGTFGKALASLGAFAVLDAPLRQYLINRMRPLIFTTALPPLLIRWSDYVLARLPEMSGRRQHLLALAGTLRRSLRAAGLATGGDSQIIPVVLGSNAAAMAAADRMAQAHFLALPIRPPTVPAGTARLRISLTAALSESDLQAIPRILANGASA